MKSFDSLIGPAARAAMRDDRRIRTVISRIVPAEAMPHVRFCRIAGRQLRVTLDGAAWVARLRFEERRLLAALVREGLDLRTVSWHVAPARNPTRRETARRAAATSSTRAGRAVLSAADSIGGDDPLARAMRRMAGHLSGVSEERGAGDREGTGERGGPGGQGGPGERSDPAPDREGSPGRVPDGIGPESGSPAAGQADAGAPPGGGSRPAKERGAR